MRILRFNGVIFPVVVSILKEDRMGKGGKKKIHLIFHFGLLHVVFTVVQNFG